MIIDFHTHLIKENADDDHFMHERVQLLLRNMAESGIDMSVSFLGHPPDYNNYEAMNNAVKKLPDCIIGFGRVGDTSNSLEVLDFIANNLKLKGLKIHHGLDRIDYESESMKKVYREIERLDLPVVFHCFYKTTPFICGIGEKYKFPVIMGHMGGLWDERSMTKCIDCAEKNKNVYLETSSAAMFQKIEEAVHRLGAERILFGSDGARVHPGPELEKIRILHITDKEKELIAGLNAKRLLGI